MANSCDGYPLMTNLANWSDLLIWCLKVYGYLSWGSGGSKVNKKVTVMDHYQIFVHKYIGDLWDKIRLIWTAF